MSTSIGVLAIDNAFLTVKSARDDVISARKPKVKVKVASVRPMMVRNCKCQPNASFLFEMSMKLTRVSERSLTHMAFGLSIRLWRCQRAQDLKIDKTLL